MRSAQNSFLSLNLPKQITLSFSLTSLGLISTAFLSWVFVHLVLESKWTDLVTCPLRTSNVEVSVLTRTTCPCQRVVAFSAAFPCVAS